MCTCSPRIFLNVYRMFYTISFHCKYLYNSHRNVAKTIYRSITRSNSFWECNQHKCMVMWTLRCDNVGCYSGKELNYYQCGYPGPSLPQNITQHYHTVFIKGCNFMSSSQLIGYSSVLTLEVSIHGNSINYSCICIHTCIYKGLIAN